MIIASLSIIIALYWLLIETNYLTIRLVCGKIPNKDKAIESIKLLMPGKIEPTLLLTTARLDHYSNFIVKDMPISQGVNIICKVV
jgi:hypothetical protein